MRYKPSKADRENYARACKEAESKGFKIHKSNNGLSIYGYVGDKYVRISNHFLPLFDRNFIEINRTLKVDDDIVLKSQKKVFEYIGVVL